MNKPDYTKSPTGSDAWVSEMEFYQTENYMDREKDNHLQGDLIWTKRWELKLKGAWSSKIQKIQVLLLQLIVSSSVLLTYSSVLKQNSLILEP